MTKKMPLPLVEVVWIDAEEEGEVGWNDFAAIKKYAKKPCPLMRSIGYQVHRSDTHIALVSTLSDDQKVSSTCEKIPAAFIQCITALTPQKATKEEKGPPA